MPHKTLHTGKYKGRRYPWDTWFKKSKFTTVKGTDYTCLSHGMAMNIRAAAKARGMVVSITIHEDKVDVVVTSRAGDAVKGIRRAT